MYYDLHKLTSKDLISVPLSQSFFYKNEKGRVRPTFRFYRWVSVISLQLIFFLSFFIDIQILEGTLNASRLLGFHLIDIFTTLEVFVATHTLPINLIIGTVTIAIFYLLVGGRTYCGWACPYSILADISEALHRKLVQKKVIKKRDFSHYFRYIFWVIFLLLSFASGLIVFESINVVGILSRMVVYGMSLGLIWVALVFCVDIFFSKRAWCTYVCPLGTTYGLLGWLSASKVEWNDKCDHCMACHGVCPEPHVLELTKAKYDKERENKNIKNQYILSGDCTMCGRCIDVCHQDALKYNFRLTKLL